ncbi:MAG: FixH family protein [Sphingomonadales bacterium]|jgi:nitrogen fixation protein FixH
MNAAAQPITAKPFTGRHAAAMFVAFFGVVIAVNISMARLASGTFSGTVVDNSYVASQEFNRWLADARRQAALGWATPVSLDAARHVRVGVPGAGFTVSGTAHHPLGRAADVPLRFARHGSFFVAATPLPAGRWQLRIDVRRGRAVKKLALVLA